MMKNVPGYPLPSGELGEDEIVCQLVYLPDRPEYWQAFVSSLHYLATWRAWERDTDKRGKAAAANWRAANELTMECWRMACLQELQDNVAEILAIMQLGNSCCDDQDITDGDRYTDRVEDGEGDVPQNIIDAGYAEDAADWDGFDDYKCMIAHVTIDQLEARLREIDDVVERAGPYLAVAAALSAIIGVIVATGGLVIVFGLLAGIGTVSALYYALIEFGPIGDLADDVATSHDELACVIHNADGDVNALIALNDKIDELFTTPEALILKNMNLGPTLKSLYAGRYDQQDIANELLDAGYELDDFNCDCLDLGEHSWFVDFNTETFEGWFNSGGYLDEAFGKTGFGYRGLFLGDDFLYVPANTLAAICCECTPDTGDTVFIHKISFWYRFTGPEYTEIHLNSYHEGGLYSEAIFFTEEWTFHEAFFNPPLEIIKPEPNAIQIRAASDLGGAMYIDDITVHMDYVPAP